MVREKRHLLEKINSLGFTEHLEIYKIIQSMNVVCSENNNGVFFNLTTLSNDTLQQIEDFVNYCHSNKVELDEYDQKLNECKYRNNINIIKNVSYTSSFNEPIDKKERWKELMETVDKTSIVKEFVEKLNNSVDKQHSRKGGTKFLMARKKYAKRYNNECDLKDELEKDPYQSIK
jgi:hypothetical protein